MIPEKLAERLMELGQEPERIYSVKTRKASFSGSEPVPWMKNFFFNDNMSSRDDNINWLQDAASFAPVIALDPKPNELILDMAAAPGMKTALICRLMKNKGHIIACEIDRKRILRLKSNIRKFNCEICESIRCDASRFKSHDKFDKILLDAPCSGEGMVTKQKKLFKVWSEKRISRMQKSQKRLIKKGFELLKDSGTLVYSTCTFGPEENEEVVNFLLDNNPNAAIEKIHIEGLNHSTGIESWKGKTYKEHGKFIRIWPYLNNTNGMFVAKIRKA